MERNKSTMNLLPAEIQTYIATALYNSGFGKRDFARMRLSSLANRDFTFQTTVLDIQTTLSEEWNVSQKSGDYASSAQRLLSSYKSVLHIHLRLPRGSKPQSQNRGTSLTYELARLVKSIKALQSLSVSDPVGQMYTIELRELGQFALLSKLELVGIILNGPALPHDIDLRYLLLRDCMFEAPVGRAMVLDLCNQADFIEIEIGISNMTHLKLGKCSELRKFSLDVCSSLILLSSYHEPLLEELKIDQCGQLVDFSHLMCSNLKTISLIETNLLQSEISLGGCGNITHICLIQAKLNTNFLDGQKFPFLVEVYIQECECSEIQAHKCVSLTKFIIEDCCTLTKIEVSGIDKKIEIEVWRCPELSQVILGGDGLGFLELMGSNSLQPENENVSNPWITLHVFGGLDRVYIQDKIKLKLLVVEGMIFSEIEFIPERVSNFKLIRDEGYKACNVVVQHKNRQEQFLGNGKRLSM